MNKQEEKGNRLLPETLEAVTTTLARIFEYLCRFPESENLLRGCIENNQLQFKREEHHHAVIKAKTTLALFYYRRCFYSQAGRLFDETFGIIEKTLGQITEENPSFISTQLISNFANLYLKRRMIALKLAIHFSSTLLS